MNSPAATTKPSVVTTDADQPSLADLSLSSHRLDVNSPGLLVHGTFIENIPGLIAEGPNVSSRKAVVGYLGTQNGKAVTRRDAGDFVYLERTSTDSFRGGTLTWTAHYDTYLVFDETAEQHLEPHDANLPQAHAKAKYLPSSSICALVLDSSAGTEYRHDMLRRFPNSDYVRGLDDFHIRNIPLKSTGRQGTIEGCMTRVYDEFMTFDELMKRAIDAIGRRQISIFNTHGELIWSPASI